LLTLGKTLAHAAQDKPDKGNGLGKAILLVARPGLGDPFFKESVVLMFPPSVKIEDDLIVGLIVNKPTHVTLGDVFPEEKALKDRTDTTYFGGPVEPRVPGVVFRSSKADKPAVQLFEDVYVSFDLDDMKGRLKGQEKTPDLRLFVGRAQWAPAQLQNEMNLGAWYGLPVDASLVFNTNPQYLWHKLYDRAEHAPVAELLNKPFEFAASPRLQ